MDSVSSFLQHLNNEELREILNGQTDKIEELAKEDRRLKDLENERDMLIASNKSLAEFNLSREPAYNEARKQLVEAHKAAVELKRQVEGKRDRINELSKQTSLETTLALMQTAAAEAEEESEKIAGQFLSSEITVDAFLTQFLSSRKASHLRRIKTEKLMEYVRQQQRNAGQEANNSIHPSRPAPPPPNSMPFTPYPVVQGGMPQVPGSFPFARSPYPPY